MQKFLLTQLTPSRKLIWAARVGGADQAPTAPTPFLGQGLEIRAVVVTAGGHAVARAHTAHGAEVGLGAAATERANKAPGSPVPLLDQGLVVRAVGVLAAGHTEARALATHSVEEVVLGASIRLSCKRE